MILFWFCKLPIRQRAKKGREQHNLHTSVTHFHRNFGLLNLNLALRLAFVGRLVLG